MARKNLIGVFETDSDASASEAVVNSRPIASLHQATRSPRAVGGITKSLDSITQKIERAEEIERRMALGETIVELDPALLESSFVKDRLVFDPKSLADLTEQIREHGQQVPILVRPNEKLPGGYQIAFGHRRVAAAKALGTNVKAVIKHLTDEQLVVSQGQENNARENLTYIERAMFAVALEDLNFGRDTIMSALGIDKAALSKMISVVRGQPKALIEYIGAAPEIGRRRWLELVELLKVSGHQPVLDFISTPNAQTYEPQERFKVVVDFLSMKSEKKARSFEPIKDLPVRWRAASDGTVLLFDTRTAPGFDEFVQARLSELFREYKQIAGD